MKKSVLNQHIFENDDDKINSERSKSELKLKIDKSEIFEF